jgi:signal transduction histidine kinase/ligand-binding sensor domain-containing protein
MLQRNWTTHDGLPQSRVKAIARGHDGYLWLGTEAGLARFDGAHFKTFGLQEGLGAITVLALLEARDGTLWISTLGGGVSALRNGQVERTITQGLPSSSILSLAEDAEGHVWAGNDSGFARLEKDRFVPVPDFPNGGKSGTAALYCDRNGTMWVGMAGGMLWQWNSGRWAPSDESSPRDVTALGEDSAGRLWAATGDHQVWCREGETWRNFLFPDSFHAPVNSLAAAPDGTIWLNFYREGLCGLRDGRYIMPKLPREKLLDFGETVAVSPDGQILLGTSTSGLFVLTPSHLTMATIGDADSNESANFIGALAEIAPGEFLVGTQGRGLYRWSAGQAVSVNPELGLSPNLVVNALVYAHDGRTWVSTGSGLFQSGDHHGEPWSRVDTPYPNVWEICADGADGLWVGFGHGKLFHLSGGAAQEVPFESGRAPIRGLAQEADGTLWVGTRGNGLHRRKGPAWQRFGQKEGLLSEVIRVVNIAPNGTVWVGTAGGGLARWNGDRFVSLTTRNGLPDNTVSQIMTDEEGRLWVGTNRGMAILSAEDVAEFQAGRLSSFRPLVIDRSDGLLSEEFTIVPPVRMSSGQFAFATTRGFALLRPGDFHADDRVPPILVEGMVADGRPVHPEQGRLVLSPGVGRVEIQFTGFNFTAPQRLRFHSRLTPLESEWGKAGTQRSVEYRNLAPGHYRFDVSASTGNGNWASPPASVEIELLPHFWQRGWFRVAVAIAALGAVAFLVRWRERWRLRRKIEALERRQAVDTERARIARDLHDDVGASLTQVALLSELVRSNLARQPDKAGDHASEIFTTAQEMTRALDEIVWAVDPTHDALERSALFLGSFIQNYARTAGLQVRLDFPGTLPAAALSSTTRHHLYLAIKEVLHNIVKHAAATEIRVSLKIEADWLKLTIEDNGRGFDGDSPVTAPGANGLINLQRRLEQVRGKCARRSVPGRGTSVEILAPWKD